MIKLVGVLLLGHVCCAFANAQVEKKLGLPDVKSVPSYTAWLKEVLDNFSFYERKWTVYTETVKIKEITFQNCVMKFESSTVRRWPDPPIRFGEQTNLRPPVEIYTYYVFDFGQIDEANVVLKSTSKTITEISLPTINRAPLVYYISNPNTSAERAGKRSSVTFSVQSKASAKIGEGVRALIGLCKETVKNS